MLKILVLSKVVVHCDLHCGANRCGRAGAVAGVVREHATAPRRRGGGGGGGGGGGVSAARNASCVCRSGTPYVLGALID